MKTEYLLATALGMFGFGYVLDLISGPFTIALQNPFVFLSTQYLTTYPFTAVSIAAKTVSIFIVVTLAVQTLAGKKYFLASTLLFITGALMELYAIQQIATQSLLISLQWTLALAYTAVVLLFPSLLYLIVGSIKTAHKNLTNDPYDLDADQPTP